MDAMLIPIVAIVLGCGIPIVAIIFEHFTKKAKLRVIEKAIEQGQPVDELSLDGKKRPRVPYRGGMIALAVGLGIGIFALLVGQSEGDALYPLLGVATIPALIGIMLIVNDRINYDRLFNKEPNQQ
ncbi:MAG: DUF6249 domain-containing protein [Acidobacteriota bacterium]